MKHSVKILEVGDYEGSISVILQVSADSARHFAKHLYGELELEDVDRRRYYVQDASGTVGNAVSWWASEAEGYTCLLEHAHIFTADEIRKRGATRETDIPWPVEVIKHAANLQVDHQHLPDRAEIKDLLP